MQGIDDRINELYEVLNDDRVSRSLPATLTLTDASAISGVPVEELERASAPVNADGYVDPPKLRLETVINSNGYRYDAAQRRVTVRALAAWLVRCEEERRAEEVRDMADGMRKALDRAREAESTARQRMEKEYKERFEALTRERDAAVQAAADAVEQAKAGAALMCAAGTELADLRKKVAQVPTLEGALAVHHRAMRVLTTGALLLYRDACADAQEGSRFARNIFDADSPLSVLWRREDHNGAPFTHEEQLLLGIAEECRDAICESEAVE